MTAALTEVRPVLSYKDPTGEQATRNVDLDRQARRRTEGVLQELGEAIEHLRDSFTHADPRHRPVIAARFAACNRLAARLSTQVAALPKRRARVVDAARWVRVDGRTARIGDGAGLR